MKKLLFIIIIFAALSCEKESMMNPTGIGNVCAECTELNTGYEADRFCGTPQEVDLYVKSLKSITGQRWTCTIK